MYEAVGQVGRKLARGDFWGVLLVTYKLKLLINLRYDDECDQSQYDVSSLKEGSFTLGR